MLAGLWTVGILLAVTIPTGSIPEVHSPFGLDKVVHAVLFAGFGLLWLRGLCPPARIRGSSHMSKRGVLLLVGGIFFALGTEVYQHFAPIERTADPYDAVADLIGFLVAFGGYQLYIRMSERSPV